MLYLYAYIIILNVPTPIERRRYLRSCQYFIHLQASSFHYPLVLFFIFLGSSVSFTVFSLSYFLLFQFATCLVGPLSKFFPGSFDGVNGLGSPNLHIHECGEESQPCRDLVYSHGSESIQSNQNSCNQTSEAACLMKLRRKLLLGASIYFDIRYQLLS